MPIDTITRPRTAATPARSVSLDGGGPTLRVGVIGGRRRGSSAKATTTAASSMARPVASKTVTRPNTARIPPSAGPKIRPPMSAPDSQP